MPVARADTSMSEGGWQQALASELVLLCAGAGARTASQSGNGDKDVSRGRLNTIHTPRPLSEGLAKSVVLSLASGLALTTSQEGAITSTQNVRQQSPRECVSLFGAEVLPFELIGMNSELTVVAQHIEFMADKDVASTTSWPNQQHFSAVDHHSSSPGDDEALGSFTFEEVFVSDAPDADFVCSTPCDGVLYDSIQCDGPFACNMKTCAEKNVAGEYPKACPERELAVVSARKAGGGGGISKEQASLLAQMLLSFDLEDEAHVLEEYGIKKVRRLV